MIPIRILVTIATLGIFLTSGGIYVLFFLDNPTKVQLVCGVLATVAGVLAMMSLFLATFRIR